MRRLLLLTLIFSLLLPLPVLGEGGGFDLSALESREDVYAFQDTGTADTVYRFSDQPFLCRTENPDVQAVAFLDFLDLALEGCVTPRLTLALESPEALYGDALLLTVGKDRWRLTLTSVISEYDGVYYEDYAFCFSQDSLPLLEAMARGKAENCSFTLLDGEEVLLSGEMPLPAEAAQTVYDLFAQNGGSAQALDAVAERWPFEKSK